MIKWLKINVNYQTNINCQSYWDVKFFTGDYIS